MNYRTPLLGLSIFVVISTVLTCMVFTTLRRNVSGPTNVYSAVFSDASGLREGDDVRMAGVRVGRVQSVQLVEDTLAKVVFQVQDDQQVYGNTVASVTYQNIVGQRYLGLALGHTGGPAELAPGSEIPLERTEPSFDIGLLLNGFEPLFSVLDPGKVDDLTSGIIQALQGDANSITGLVDRTATMTETLAGRDELLGDVITGLNQVVKSLAQQNNNLNSVLVQSRRIITDLNSRRAALVSNMGSIAAVIRRLSDISQSVYPSLRELINRQPGFAQHMADIEPQLAFFGANLPVMMKTVSNFFGQGAYVSAYACNFDIYVLPGLWQVIPQILDRADPSGHPTNSPKCRPAG
ncbi:MlaD family protein [Mycobacteroides sp. LB1]|uniref:MCE family protein n=1 Tax=Mycobacteroides sp. LB1 TaxID=2750814 RepID=UPI0015DDAD24|nr:MCE family protein [Mycobacteroides sp. LB1]